MLFTTFDPKNVSTSSGADSLVAKYLIKFQLLENFIVIPLV